MYRTAIFGSCGTCHTEFGQAYDKDTTSVTEAHALLKAKVEQCNHDGVGAPILDDFPIGGSK